MYSHATSIESQHACPVWTNHCSTREERIPAFEDIRAYKLGNQRRSYNECELIICKTGDLFGQTNVQTPTVTQTAQSTQDSGSENQPADIQQDQHQIHDADHQTLAAGTSYQWTPVTRGACRKGCTGPILRNIQRLGRLGRVDCRSSPKATSDSAKLTATSGKKVASKDSRFMWLSIDEASNHVGNRSFRLVVRAYNDSGESLLGTGCSAPIRVLSNNDVTTGAAAIGITLSIRGDWKGWDQLPASRSPNTISQMMCLPLKSSLDRQPQLAQAEPQTPNPSSESSQSLSLRPPVDLDSDVDGFTDTSPFKVCDELESSVLPPVAVTEQVSMQHDEAEHSCSLSQAPAFRETSPHSMFHSSRHIPSLYGGGGQMYNMHVSKDNELLKIIKHAQNSMAVAMQCVSTAAAAIHASAPDKCQQLQPHRNKTGSGTPPTGAVFEFPELKLSFTPKHGSMLAFCANEVLHGTRIPDVAGNGCQRIGSAIALQRQAINVAIAEHTETKQKLWQKQEERIAAVKARHAEGVDKKGNPLKRRKRNA